MDEERIRLRFQAALDFFVLLQVNEVLLRKMADEDERLKQEALSRVYALLLRSSRVRDAQELDPSTRPLPWTYDAETVTWTCEQLPNRGTVSLTEGNWCWEGCIEQPDRFKHRSHWFVDLVDALEWAENQLMTVQRTTEEAVRIEAEKQLEPRLRVETITTEERARLAPYWLDPAIFESQRITYRVLVELDYAPYAFKTWELSFGKQWRYDEQYASPTSVARELQIDPVQLIIEQPLGPNDSWNRIHSRVTYFQEGIAAAQAQQSWDHSRIVQQYREGKIERARYGFQETETGYCTWLGGCENPNRPWSLPQPRTRYLSDKALRATLIHALDIDGFRRFIGISKDDISDDELLERLHKQRAKLEQIPKAARAESDRWLREHREGSGSPARIGQGGTSE